MAEVNLDRMAIGQKHLLLFSFALFSVMATAGNALASSERVGLGSS
jgi:hypothetical protein